GPARPGWSIDAAECWPARVAGRSVTPVMARGDGAPARPRLGPLGHPCRGAGPRPAEPPPGWAFRGQAHAAGPAHPHRRTRPALHPTPPKLQTSRIVEAAVLHVVYPPWLERRNSSVSLEG